MSDLKEAPVQEQKLSDANTKPAVNSTDTASEIAEKQSFRDKVQAAREELADRMEDSDYVTPASYGSSIPGVFRENNLLVTGLQLSGELSKVDIAYTDAAGKSRKLYMTQGNFLALTKGNNVPFLLKGNLTIDVMDRMIAEGQNAKFNGTITRRVSYSKPKAEGEAVREYENWDLTIH